MTVFDAIIVGSGPAGVSAAFPLVQAGLKVLMLDAGKTAPNVYPQGSYLHNRASESRQWEWMIGKDFHALRNASATSPKLRVAAHAHVFQDFLDRNQIRTEDFVAIGSLAAGGLSNAWGCGVARLSDQELDAFPFPAAQILPSYAAVSKRMGLSGTVPDDLAGYFGVDDWAQAPIALDAVHRKILASYEKKRKAMAHRGFALGRSRVAALSADMLERKACDLSGNCLWGCSRGALYNASGDLYALKKFSNFTYCDGVLVQDLARAGENIRVIASGALAQTFEGRRVLLAAGTLATTRLALKATRNRDTLPLLSCPTAAFMLFLPRMFGSPREAAFGLGQLSFVLSISESVSAFGSLFNPVGIPVSEFARYMPFSKRHGIDILANLLSACAVGNVFLPGQYSGAKISLAVDGCLAIQGGYVEETKSVMAGANGRLRALFLRLGAVMLPGSFTMGRPGGDVHYAGSLPMSAHPQAGQTDRFGQLHGLPGVHIVDGACLSRLTEKSHTLTIMANADRIGRRISEMLAA